jgi:hypothetical protein
MSADLQGARKLYGESLAQSKKVGMKEGVRHAKVALGRLERSSDSENRGKL